MKESLELHAKELSTKVKGKYNYHYFNNEEDGEKKIYTSISNKLRGRNDKVDSSLNDCMKKLHNIYVDSTF